MNKSYNSNPNTVDLIVPQSSSLPLKQPSNDTVFDPKQILQEISTQQIISIPQMQSQMKDLKLTLRQLVLDLRKIKKDVSSRPTVNHMMENTILVTSLIQGDPNIMKLIKAKQTTSTVASTHPSTIRKISQQQQQPTLSQKSPNHQLKHLYSILGNKLSTVSDGLSILYSMFKQLEKHSHTQLSSMRLFLQQKTHSIQDQVNMLKMQQLTQRTALLQKLQSQYQATQEKLRVVETGQAWQGKEMKTRLGEKVDKDVFERSIAQSLQQSRNMFRTFCQSSTQLVNPEKINSLQRAIKQSQHKFTKDITQCHLRIGSIQSNIASQLVSIEFYRKQRTSIQKRLSTININFSQLHSQMSSFMSHQQRIVSVESDLRDKEREMGEMKRTLRSLSITEGFQQMLAEIDPQKILAFEGRIGALQGEREMVVKQFVRVNQEIEAINNKFDITGVLVPNKARQKEHSLDDLKEIIDGYFVENRYANKIARMQSDVNQNKVAVEAIRLLQKKVSRLQKQSDHHRLLQQFGLLQQRVYKQLKTLSSKVQSRISLTQLQKSYLEGVTSKLHNVQNDTHPHPSQQQQLRSGSFRKTLSVWENGNSVKREVSSSRLGRNTATSARKSVLLAGNLLS